MTKAKRRPASRPVTTTTTNREHSRPLPQHPFGGLDVFDPFAAERAELEEVILLRAAHVASLGLVVPERLTIAELRRIAIFDRPGKRRAA